MTVTLIQLTGSTRDAREALAAIGRPGRVLPPGRRGRPARGRRPGRRAALAGVAGGVAREVATAGLAGLVTCLWARMLGR